MRKLSFRCLNELSKYLEKGAPADSSKYGKSGFSSEKFGKLRSVGVWKGYNGRDTKGVPFLSKNV